MESALYTTQTGAAASSCRTVPALEIPPHQVKTISASRVTTSNSEINPSRIRLAPTTTTLAHTSQREHRR